MEQKFRKDGNQTREEFLAQFSDTTEELTVLIRHAWTKGSSRYNKIGNEEIVEVYYNLPWLGDDKNAFGTIYWLAKKKLLGYPYPPKFKERSYYRLKVRKCKSGENNYYLEEVLEKEIDIMKDDNIYFATLKKYLDTYREETKEVTVCCAEDLDISKTKNPVQLAIRRGVLDCSAILEEDGKIKPVSRCITVPFDDRHFSANKKLKFKAGKNYRLKVMEEKDNPNAMSLVQVLEENVEDEALSAVGAMASQPVSWPVEGFEDFEIRWSRYEVYAGNECVPWQDKKGVKEVSVYLQCDEDNWMTAHKTTAEFLKFYRDRDALRKKIFEAIADEMANENGKIDTWDEYVGEITKTAFMARISFSHFDFGPDAVDIMINLDDLFTDHDYNLSMSYDGTLDLQGLIG